jgi:hypothetical protein
LRLSLPELQAGRGIHQENIVSKVADSIRRSLKEALAYAEGKADEGAYRIRLPKLDDDQQKQGPQR